MFEESLPEHEPEFAAMKINANKLGISPEAIRRGNVRVKSIRVY
jgi:hypothetical protein|tara:strand:+ start:2846 stop:2977 length:132 start_codon:yes stop_codon:yes gene_type:complete